MNNIQINFTDKDGKVKPMHSVNNGPIGVTNVRGMSNAVAYKAAGIPFARIHDASFYSGYGGSHTVDINNIFTNFDADETLPESYDFTLTDQYLKDIESVGTKVFYRLGSKIEHEIKKYGTIPPKNSHKWARICEHIIRHYTEGWANGFHMDIEYWEIWNEPDCQNPDGSHPCWQGTREEFLELFTITLKHLKNCFPNLKIGGPAFTSSWQDDYNTLLFDKLKAEKLPLDFYSFHGYNHNPALFAESVYHAKELLEKYGYNDTELILNEWNYVKGWLNEEWIYTIKAEKNLKGASFVAASMCTCQYTPLDHFMYYDARPCCMNGMFDTDTLELLKPYYPFVMFNALYKIGTAVKLNKDCDTIYACAADSKNESAVFVTYFDDDDNAPDKELKISLQNIGSSEKCLVSYYLLDQDNDMKLVREESFTSDNFSVLFKMKLYDSYLITIKKK